MRRLGVEAALSLLLLGALLLTNRYLSLPADAAWVGFAGGDSYSYLAMAKTFPSLPTDVNPPIHHAQRIFLPYVLGGVAWLLGVSAEEVFRAFALLVVLTVVGVFQGILGRLELPSETRMILLAFLILNPYVFRYYLAIPWMLSDLGFQLGVAVLLLGLVRQSLALTFAGLVVATLAKQTALALIPGVMAWIWWEWGGPRNVRGAQAVGAAVLVPLVYQGTMWLAQAFSTPAQVIRHVSGLFRWMATSYSLVALATFAARGFIGFVFPATFVLSLAVTRTLPAGWYRNRRLWLCLVLAGSICLQPVLGGPATTNQSMTRLTMLGYLPFLVGVGILLGETSLPAPMLRRLVFLSAFTTAMGSFHHFYSFLGSVEAGRTVRFVAVYLGSALLLFVGVLGARHLGTPPRD